MTDDGGARPIRPSLTAPALAAIIALAGILLFARFMRGVEVIQCMTLEGHQRGSIALISSSRSAEGAASDSVKARPRLSDVDIAARARYVASLDLRSGPVAQLDRAPDS
jgi:hypothetical protein